MSEYYCGCGAYRKSERAPILEETDTARHIVWDKPEGEWIEEKRFPARGNISEWAEVVEPRESEATVCEELRCRDLVVGRAMWTPMGTKLPSRVRLCAYHVQERRDAGYGVEYFETDETKE